MMYQVEGPKGAVSFTTSDDMRAREYFRRALLDDGLPSRGRITLTVHWTADGRWGAKGARLSRILLFANSDGVWDIDGSGVPSPCAVGDEMAAQWAAAPIIRSSGPDPKDDWTD